MNMTIDNIKTRWSRFREWQKTPYVEPAYPDHEQHSCLNCGESYEGKFCPRCGQTAKTRRLTLKNAVSNFMDVWGLGGRSMPRLLMHLTLRPGYMMRDYIHGHRQPYFPIFKTLFLLVVFYVLMAGLLNIERVEQKDKATIVSTMRSAIKTVLTKEEIITLENEKNDETLITYMDKVEKWFRSNNVATIILVQLIGCIAMRMVFRRSPLMGTLTLTEHFYIQILTACQMMFFSIIFLAITRTYFVHHMFSLPDWLYLIILYCDYRQLFGFGRIRTVWKMILVSIIETAISVFILAALGSLILLIYML